MTRGLIAWALLFTGWIAILCDIVQLRIGGLFLAGVILLATAWWVLGVWHRIAAWFRGLITRRVIQDEDAVSSLDSKYAHRKAMDR